METTDEQIRQQAAECHARKIRQARMMSPREKFLSGAELFEYACGITLAGIAHQHPQWSKSECKGRASSSFGNPLNGVVTGNDGLLALIRILNEVGTPYMLVGSYSSNFYGIPRSTKDADLVFQFDSRSLDEIAKRLPEGLSFDRQSTFEMVTATRKEVILIEGSEFQIELFHLSEDEFDQARFQGREKITFGDDITTWMPRMEDVIVQKLRWAKGGARSKDFDDVVAILGVQEKVDFTYIAEWCEKHGTLEVMAKARAEAGV